MPSEVLMDQIDAQRLWPHVQRLLRAPAPPADAELRRAARMLVSERPDAVELLLAQWLASAREQHALPAGESDTAPTPTEAAPTLARRSAGFGLREAALVTAGVAGGTLLGGLLDDDAGIDLS
jgi:hypothetical protein